MNLFIHIDLHKYESVHNCGENQTDWTHCQDPERGFSSYLLSFILPVKHPTVRSFTEICMVKRHWRLKLSGF